MNKENINLEKENLSQTMRRIYKRKLSTSSGGNISLKMNDFILITPSQTDKSCMTANQIGQMDFEGKALKEEILLSMESLMHCEIYKARKDIKAIVHAHPTYGTLFALDRNLELCSSITGESWYMLGNVEFVPYQIMGSINLAQAVAKSAQKGNNALLLEKHGVITMGKTLYEAYNRMEVLEEAAHLSFMGRMLDIKLGLDKKELEKINNLKS